MIFAALKPDSKEEVYGMIVQAIEATGTAEAVKQEPWHWITWVGVVVLAVTIVGLLLRFMTQLQENNSEQTKDFVEVGREFTNALKENNERDLINIANCHNNHLQAVKIASDAAHSASTAAHAASSAAQVAANSANDMKSLAGDVNRMVTKVMEKLA